MSALQIDKEKDKQKTTILNTMQTIRNQIVDVEILTKSKYDNQTPSKVKDTVERLKQNIFNLDISLSDNFL